MEKDLNMERVLEIWKAWGRYRVKEDRLEYDVGMIQESHEIPVEEAQYLYHRLREWQITGK